MDVHAQFADFALQIVAGFAVTRLVRRHGGQTQPPAQPGPVVPQFHAVPAQRRNPGGLHAAGPAADYHDPADFPGGADGEGVQRFPARADIQAHLTCRSSAERSWQPLLHAMQWMMSSRRPSLSLSG